MKAGARRILAGCLAACLLAPLFAAGQAAPSRRGAAGPPPPALAPDPQRLARLHPEELAKLREQPLNYFRFTNTVWAERVCQHFSRELATLPTVRLHGDAHIEQYAITREAYGLDDFDDSTRGPSVVDLVRFLGSVDLAARQRGWTSHVDRLFERFLAGYRDGLERAALFSDVPAVVTRLRAAPIRDRAGFLAWADGLMQPMDAADRLAVEDAAAKLGAILRSFRPEYPNGYLEIKKAGWLRIGVGSVLMRKVLVRAEGVTASDLDDVVLEGKEVSDLRGVSCIEVPKSGAVFRVLAGVSQVGRIKHDILAVLPRLEVERPGLSNFWIRNWDDSYVEVRLADFASVNELAEVVFDSGLQLGANNIFEANSMLEAQQRRAELEATRHLEPRIKALARQLAQELYDQWQAFVGRSRPQR